MPDSSSPTFLLPFSKEHLFLCLHVGLVLNINPPLCLSPRLCKIEATVMICKMGKQMEQVMQDTERGNPLMLRNSRNGIRGREYKITDFVSFLPKME